MLLQYANLHLLPRAVCGGDIKFYPLRLDEEENYE
jgi:hypothetical protein